MNRIKWSAVFIGLLVDLGGSIGLVFAMLAAVTAGVPLISVDAEGNALDASSETFMITFGFAFTVFGGFLAGVIAARDFVLHGAVMGVVSLLVTLPLVDWSSPLTKYDLVSVAGLLPAATFGGYLARFSPFERGRAEK